MLAQHGICAVLEITVGSVIGHCPAKFGKCLANFTL